MGASSIASAPGGADRLQIPELTGRVRRLPSASALRGRLPVLPWARLSSIYGVSGALVCGDALGNLGCRFERASILWLLAASAGVFFLFRAKKLGLCVALLALIGAAALRVSELGARGDRNWSIRHYADGTRLRIEGVVWREPERSYGRQRLLVHVERAYANSGPWRPCSGLVRVTLLEGGNYRIGQRVSLAAPVRFPRNFGDPGEFDYEAYMARAGIVATMLIDTPEQITVLSYQPWFPWTQIEQARAHIARFIDATLDYPEREEARALVIGDRGGLGQKVRDEFALTGMAHLLVISGLHMGFVAAAAFMLVRLALSAIPRLLIFGLANKIAALAAALAVIAYALVAGHHVSTIRAVIMVASYTIAIVIECQSEPLAAMAAAAAAIIFVIPGSTADIGFQLSFASVAAIVFGMRRYSAWWLNYCARRMLELRRAWPIYRAAGWLGGYLALSGYVTLGVGALTAYHFNQLSLIGPLANAVVVPIMGLIGTTGALCAAALSFFLPHAAAVVLRAASWFLTAGTYLAAWFAAWPMAWVRCFTPTLAELFIFYALLLLWLTRPVAGPALHLAFAAGRDIDANSGLVARRGATERWRRAAVILLLLGLGIDGAWWSYQRFFNPTLRITFLAVGQGDAAVIRFPGSRVMVIDGGGGLGPAFDPGERLVARFLWSQRVMHVEYLALSHPDLDHYGGLKFLARNFGPKEFWASAVSSPDPGYAALLSSLALRGVRLRLLSSASAVEDIAGVAIRCLNPPAHSANTHNNSSMVLMLSYGSNRVLFTGDIEAQAERALIASYPEQIRGALLKVPHHGSKTSSTPAFLDAVQAPVAIISVGHLNRFRLPAPMIVERYAAAGTRILRTDENGAVTVEIDADSMRVLPSRAAAGAPAVCTIRRGRLQS